MKPAAFASLITVSLAKVLATPAAAQELAVVEVPLLANKLVFRGEGSVTGQSGDAKSAALHFWRPLTFSTGKKPVGGRLDCDLTARDVPFTDALYDLAARDAEPKERRQRRGLTDDSESADYGPAARRYEVAGHAFKPFRHYVLSTIALREGASLYDIRLDCMFVQGDGDVGDPDYAALVHQYTSVELAEATPEADT